MTPLSRYISSDERARIEQMLEDGATYGEIGRVLGRPNATISHYVRRHNLMEPRRPRRTADCAAHAVDLYQRGVTVAVILRRHALSPTTFYAMLRRAGVPLRYPQMRPGPRRQVNL